MHPDKIALLLRRALRARVIVPGQVLHQDELARRFGVSRVPLREALRTLASEGLIDIRPGRGAVVTELNISEVEELYDLRRILEPPLAEPAVRQARLADIEELRKLVRSMDDHATESALDRDVWSGMNYAFHRRLAEVSAQVHHVHLVVQVLDLVEPYARIYVHGLGSLHDAAHRHTETLDALERRDAAALRRQIEMGLDEARARLVGSLEASSPSRPS